MLAFLPALAVLALPQGSVPPALNLPTTPPAGAIVLLSTEAKSAAQNFIRRYTKEDAGWKQTADGWANDGSLSHVLSLCEFSA